MALHHGWRGPGHQARVGGPGGAGSDETPDGFALGDAAAAALATVYESDAIAVSGIDAPAPLTISGGEYAINGGAWASAPTTVSDGDAVKVRGVAPATVSTTQDVVLTIGGVADTFSIATVANAEASDLLGRFSADPGGTRRGEVDALIGALKAAGLWTKIDVLQVYAAHDSQAALLNWKSTNYTGSAQGSPTFTADLGYAGDGVGAYVDTGFDNTTAGANWQAASGLATFAVGVNVAGAVNVSNFVLGLTDVSGSVRFNPYNGSAASGRFLNSADQSFPNASGRVGRYLVTRNGAGQTGYRNGVVMGSAGPGTLTAVAANLGVLRTNTVFSNSRVSFVMLGGGAAIWTATEAADFDAAIDAYLTAVGAN